MMNDGGSMSEALDLPEIYETAALLLEGHWQQCGLGAPSKHMCAAGALLVASGTAMFHFDNVEMFSGRHYREVRSILLPLADEVRQGRFYAGDDVDDAYKCISSWNDLESQTEENVVRVLREVAARLKEEQDK